MRKVAICGGLFLMMAPGCAHSAESPPPGSKKLFLDVHELGKVTAKDVAAAHEKDPMLLSCS